MSWPPLTCLGPSLLTRGFGAGPCVCSDSLQVTPIPGLLEQTPGLRADDEPTGWVWWHEPSLAEPSHMP